jgi:hypothetical protein
VVASHTIKIDGRLPEMNATTNEARFDGFVGVESQAASTDAVRLAQYAWLNELPGMVFGLITVVYIVTSLLALA